MSTYNPDVIEDLFREPRPTINDTLAETIKNFRKMAQENNIPEEEIEEMIRKLQSQAGSNDMSYVLPEHKTTFEIEDGVAAAPTKKNITFEEATQTMFQDPNTYTPHQLNFASEDVLRNTGVDSADFQTLIQESKTMLSEAMNQPQTFHGQLFHSMLIPEQPNAFNQVNALPAPDFSTAYSSLDNGFGSNFESLE